MANITKAEWNTFISIATRLHQETDVDLCDIFKRLITTMDDSLHTTRQLNEAYLLINQDDNPDRDLIEEAKVARDNSFNQWYNIIQAVKLIRQSLPNSHDATNSTSSHLFDLEYLYPV